MNDLEGLLWLIEKACCERLRVPTVHNLLFRVPILNNLKGLLNLTGGGGVTTLNYTIHKKRQKCSVKQCSSV